MLAIIKTVLVLSALYCAVMYALCAVSSVRTKTDVETETFHLGLCLLIALGFLGLILTHGG
jgi:hypothetical protein